ncbi:MAG: right-handed parallel beta-helix repeat-containing protein [Planctomycetota bacterium]
MKKGKEMEKLITVLICVCLTIPCHAEIIYVDSDTPDNNDGSSWGKAYKYLLDALVYAKSSGDVNEIRVAQGIYKPDCNSAAPNGSGERGLTFELINRLIIRGGYGGYGEPDPNARDIQLYETILSGDLNGDDIEVDNPLDLGEDEPLLMDNSYHVVTAYDLDSTAVLDGLTVTAGYSQDNGAGMYNENSDPTVIKCTFSRNGAAGGTDSAGSGMFNSSSSPTLIDCAFMHNAAAWPGGGGMFNKYGSSPTLINCVFIGNKSGGFDGGRAGAIKNWEGSSPTLVNCVFIGNYAQWDGGAIYSSGNYVATVSSPTFVNCTFAGNWAGRRGGAIVQASGELTLTNSIMWDNTSPEGNVVYLREGSQVDGTANVTYSDIEDGLSGFHIEEGCSLTWGEGNIDGDPCFALPGYWDDPCGTPGDANDDIWVDGDYHLQMVSPCIDAGDNNSVPADVADIDGDGNTVEAMPWDLDGHYRIGDGDCDGNSTVDMGAYEYGLFGDVDCRLDVDLIDFAIFMLAWGSEPGDLNWNPACDLGSLRSWVAFGRIY